MISGDDCFRGEHRMNQRNMDGGECDDIVRGGEQRRRPRQRLEARTLAIGLAAVADPARDRQHEFQTRFVSEPRSFEIL